MKKKYIPQQELSNITDEALLTERHIVLDLISNNKFQFLKGYKDSKDDQFKEIEDVLSKAKKKDHDFLKNYYALADDLKDDFEINKKAISKCAEIYFLIKENERMKHPISYAQALIKTNGYYFKYLSSNLKQNRGISLNAVVSCPSVFKEIPEKIRHDQYFVTSALTSNPHIYSQLSKADRLLEGNLLTALKGGLENNVKQFYQSIPLKFLNNKYKILKFIELEPKIYRFLAPRHQIDTEIAISAVKGDYKMIADVPNRLHFHNSIVQAFLYSSKLVRGRALICKFKSLTGCNLNVNKIIKKFINVLSAENITHLAKKLCNENVLDEARWTDIINKNPKTFKYLPFDEHTLTNFHSVIETAIKLDYKNFQYVQITYWHADQYTKEIYAEFLDLAIKAFKALKCKGVHPASFLQQGILSVGQLVRVITLNVKGKDQADYVNIFKYGNNDIKRYRSIYVKALNIDPKLAKIYPITNKSCSKKIFKGLNSAAKNALFDRWIKYKGINDVLEIASIKTEILKHSPQNVAITT